MKIVIEILVNRTASLAVSKNLESICKLVCPNITIKELPSLDWVRKYRGSMRIMTKAHVTLLLAKDREWKQVWYDSTSRRQVLMTTFAASVKQNNKIWSIILQVAKVGLGESSEDTVTAFKEILEDSREYIEELTKTCQEYFADFEHNLPSKENLSIDNGKEAAYATDTYNQVYYSRRLLIGEVNEALKNHSKKCITIFNIKITILNISRAR